MTGNMLINNAETKEHEAHPPHRYSLSASNWFGHSQAAQWSQQSRKEPKVIRCLLLTGKRRE